MNFSTNAYEIVNENNKSREQHKIDNYKNTFIKINLGKVVIQKVILNKIGKYVIYVV